MLQANEPLLAADQEAVPTTSSPAEMVATALGFLRRHYVIILSAPLLTVALAAVYLITTSRTFTAQASLIIDTHKFQVFQQQPMLGNVNIAVESQVELLRSDNVALAVIKSLHLTDDPEFVGSKGAVRGLLSKLPFLGAFRSAAPPPSESELTEAVLSAFQKRLTVTQVSRSSVIEVSFESTNPEHAAQIANAVGEAYIADQLRAQHQAAERAGAWLQDRLPELRAKSSAADRAIADFKVDNKIVTAGGRSMNEQRLAEINSQLVTARGLTSEARARLDRIEAVLRAYVPGSTTEAAVTDTINNPIITPLRSKLLEYSNREAEFSARYGRDHAAAVKLRRQIADIRHSILDELRRIAETYKSEYEIAKQRQAALENTFNETVAQSQTANRAQATLRELESSAQRYRALEDTFLQRYMETVQQQSFPIPGARFVSRASKALAKPNGRKRLLLLPFALAGGLAFGVGIGALREMMDHAFRTSRQVEKVLHTDCLTMLPTVDRYRPEKTSELAKTFGPQTIVPDSNMSPIWTVLNSPFSRYSKSLRSIRLSLSEGGKSSKVIGFTSALPGEGKSTVAASFALLAALEGARVILVDCDLRTASLSLLLTEGSKHGIVDTVTGKMPLKDVIWREPATNLEFLPAGIESRLANASELLASKAVKELISQLRQSYEFIIVDLPPLAPIVDVRATAHFVDLYTLVIEWGRTTVDLVEHALGDSRVVYENLHGVVLNKVDIDLLTTYEGSGKKYYGNKLYTSYGLTG